MLTYWDLHISKLLVILMCINQSHWSMIAVWDNLCMILQTKIVAIVI